MNDRPQVGTTSASAAPRQPPKRGKRWRWMRRLAVFLFIILLLPILSLTVLHLDRSHHLANQWLNRMLAPSVHITRLGGEWPLNITLERLVLADDRGPWLDLEGIRIDWPGEEWRSDAWPLPRLDIQRLSLDRLPGRQEKDSSDTGGWWDRGWLPGRLSIHTLSLGQELLPGGATFQLQGEIQEVQEGMRRLHGWIKRQDRELAQASFDMQFSSRTDHLGLHLEIDERSGLFSALTRTPAAEGHWRVRLEGSAPWRAWRGRLELHGPPLGTMTVGVTARDGRKIDLDGQWRLPDPPSWNFVRSRTEQGSIPFGLTVEHDREHHTLTLSRMTGAIPGITFDGTGSIMTGNTSPPRLFGEVHFTIPNMQRVFQGTTTPITGALRGIATLSGTSTTPQATLHLHGKRLVTSGITIDQFKSRLELTPNTHRAAGMEMSLTGLASGVAHDEKHWSTLGISGLFATIPDEDTLLLRLRTKPGAMRVASTRSIPWFHHQTTLVAAGRLRTNRFLDLHRVRLTGPDLSATGGGRFDLTGRTFSSTIRATLEDLTPLERILGGKTRGPLEISARSGGSWNDPWLELDLHGDRLTFPNLKIDSFSATFAGKNLVTAPEGTVQSQLRAHRERITLATRVAMGKNGGPLVLEGVTIIAPRARLDGHLTATLDPFVLNGRLQGTIESLAALKPWHGQDWQGRAEIDLELPPRKTPAATNPTPSPKANPRGQRKSSTTPLPGRNAKTPDDAFKATLVVHPFSASGISFRHLEIKGHGQPGRILFEVMGQGTGPEDPSFTGHGEFHHAPTDRRLLLTGLAGSWRKEPFLLHRPWNITFSEEGLAISDLDLTLADLRLRGTLKQRRGMVEGQCRIHGPLSVFDRLGIVPLRGEVQLAATLSGTNARPKVSMTIQGTNLKGQSGPPTTFPPAHISGHLGIDSDRLARLRLVVTGLGTTPAQVYAHIPVHLTLEPWSAHLAATAPFDLELQAKAKPSDLAGWLGVAEEHRLGGLLEASLHASGSIDQPRIAGTMALKQGSYENDVLGILFKDITIQGHADGKRILFDRITMTDGGRGQIEGRGQWLLERQADFPFRIETTLNQVNLPQREEIKASVSGTLVLEGSRENLDIHGTATVHRVDYHLPETDDGPQPRVVRIREKQHEETKNTRPIPTHHSRLDVRLTFPDQVFIRRPGLDSRWHGAIDIQGSLEAPRITGQLDLGRGHLKFANRRYELRRGSIRFSGNASTPPIMDVDAVTQTRDLEIRANLEGPASHPRLRFISIPELPEKDILAQLLFGRSIDTITPAQALQLAATLQSLRNGGTGIVDGIGQRLGIDQLDFTGDSVETGRVNAGKYLSDKIYLEVQKGLKADADRIQLEYDLTPDLSVQTGVDARSHTDIGIMWNMDY
ncbi:MAG: translocation/assembly module TamB [Magnetococcales bacterium]|nr:translocation/assembly module TamB [Magnetococcales bacterium]